MWSRVTFNFAKAFFEIIFMRANLLFIEGGINSRVANVTDMRFLRAQVANP